MSKILRLPRAAEGHAGNAASRTKLRPTPLQAFHVSLPRIAQELRIAPGEAVLLTGPPGCGKTSALIEHFSVVEGEGRSARWLSLDSADNDLATLTASLRQVSHPADGPGAPLRPLDYTDVFLDGLEWVIDPAARAMVERFIVDVPETSRCYATGHALRGGLLHNARLRGFVKLIPYSAFRFTDAEAAQILGETWSPWQVLKLNQVSDGWAAGLRFLALDPPAACKLLKDDRGLAAIPMEMAGYFDDVVCSAFTEIELTGMMDASVLDRFTAEALMDMPGRKCSWQMIENLVRSRIFLDYLDDTHLWVKFHPAFGRHLRNRLQCSDPLRFAELQQFAASWFGQNGFAMEAMRHASRLPDTVMGARIMEEAGGLQAELGTGPLLNFGQPVPLDQMCELPMVLLGHIYRLVRMGQLLEARQLFEQMREKTEGFVRFGEQVALDPVVAFARVIEIVLTISEDKPVDDERIAMLEMMMQSYVATQPVIAASFSSLLAMAYVDVCRYPEAATICDIGLDAIRDLGPTKVAIFIRIQQSAVALGNETVSKAVLCIEDANRLAQAEGEFGRYEVIATHILRAELHYEANELAMAKTLLQSALLEINRIGGWMSLYCSAFPVAARIDGIEIGYEAADAHLQAGEQFARQKNLPRLGRFMLIARLRELVAAHRWREATTLLEKDEFREILERRSELVSELRMQTQAQLEAARLMVEIGRPADGGRYLDQINKPYLDYCDVRLRFTFRLLAMRVAFGLRRYNAAGEHMRVALGHAMHAGLLRRAISNRHALIEVFDWSIRNGSQLPADMTAFVDEILRTADGSERDSAILHRRPRRGPGTVMANFVLSPRETEIMVLVAEGYLTKEIAMRLGISEGTVKSHRKKIHEKLGVLSKSQAIARARELLII